MKLKTMFRDKPLISLLHTTARLPDGWQRAFETWRDRADNPGRIEYVLCCDAGRNVVNPLMHPDVKGYGSRVYVENAGRRCAVDGWNTAAAASSGKLLITVSDDLFPPEAAPATAAVYDDEGTLVTPAQPARRGWDTELLIAVGDLDREAVLDIEAGSGDLMTFSLLTRAYYQRYGYIFFPEYLGMLGDNDFTAQAHQDGVVIRARHLKFVHEHPAYHTAVMDDVYAHQHRAEAWAVGKRTFKKRFPSVAREAMAVALPGETFNFQWVAAVMPLLIQLSGRFHLHPHFCTSSNVHITRQTIADALTRKLGPNMPPDFVLWVDDDNTPNILDILRLVDDLEKDPDLDIVAGWCWAGFKGPDPNNPRVSCGHFDENDLAQHMGYREMMAAPSPLVPIDFTGFPTVLMRYDALVKAGDTPFAPRLNSKHPWGFNSEDTSFCLNARDRGPLRIACDRRVKVLHWKVGMDEPPAMPPAMPALVAVGAVSVSSVDGAGCSSAPGPNVFEHPAPATAADGATPEGKSKEEAA